MMTARDRYIAYRRSLGATPRLTHQMVQARGLNFAVWTTPPVAGVPPLVCVNGGLLYDHSLLWPALSPLAATRQLVFYDQRGRGKTGAPPGAQGARIEHDAGDIPALREALGISQWDLLGHSWGGAIAMLGAERDQAGTRALVLVCPVGITSAWMPAVDQAALPRLTPAERAILERYPPAALAEDDPGVHSSHSRALYPAWFADRSLAELFAPPRAVSVTGAAVAARLRREGYDWTLLLSALRIPTLVLQTERDLLPSGAARGVAEALPQARLVELRDSGHMPFWETPERFFKLVESFLSAPSPNWVPP